MNDDLCGVFLLTNTNTGNKYIGKSMNIFDELSNIFDALLDGNFDKNERLQHEVDQYGTSGLQFEILEVCEKDDLDWVEEYYIKRFKYFKL